VLDDASAILSVCSGTMACAGRTLSFAYGPGVAVRIREAPLGDGLGARVWAIAHAFCRELAARPGAVAGRAVLEIGAGTGIVGIVAARLGAARAVGTGARAGALDGAGALALRRGVRSPGGGLRQGRQQPRAAGCGLQSKARSAQPMRTPRSPAPSNPRPSGSHRQ
jgi:hypothetical protein